MSLMWITLRFVRKGDAEIELQKGELFKGQEEALYEGWSISPLKDSIFNGAGDDEKEKDEEDGDVGLEIMFKLQRGWARPAPLF